VIPKFFDEEEEEEEEDPVCTKTIPNPLYTDPQPQQRLEPAAVPAPRAPTTPIRPPMSTPARKPVPTTIHTSTPSRAGLGPVPRPGRLCKRPAYLEDYDTN
jgi:hypothetical protein